MTSKEEAKQEVRKLMETFSNIPSEELNKKPEEQIKFLFIEPLFKVLGWEKEDIEKETRVLKGRADYILRIGNQEVLVIEAKKTSVNLTEDEGRQAVSYAYHRKIKFAVLTNFKEIRVYHALSNIKTINKNLLKDKSGYLSIKYDEFEKQFERLWLLSRESFEKGEIGKLLSAKDERLSKPIDESILDDLLQFREWLSKDLKKLRVYLTQEQIDEVVQILIDRLIFMRSVEDRGLEDKDFLLNIITDFQQGRTDKRLWDLLKMQFRNFDKEYNSKLFAEGLLEKEGFFDEITLMKVIKGLYFGTKDHQERYMFDEIPGDLLGNIYEQYLGTILKGTEKRVTLDEESGKRKKMGIYYTPSYIVDYIVKNTVGEYIKNKSIDEIFEVRIVDPACGSGSFLIRAFREACDSIENRLKKGERSKKWQAFKDYKDRLNLSQKTTILTNCIYGVDLDEKAVELAQLNLLLRLLEDETKETKKLLLPNMKDNIKCGNSLIDDLSVSDKTFNWKAQFPNIFKNGGFDVVVGNPPYVSQKGTEDSPNIAYLEREYYRTAYKTLSESDLKTRGGVKLNLFGLWIEKATTLLNNYGLVGLIVHKNLLKVESYKFLRKYLLDNVSVKEIIDLGANVFEGVTGETIILILSNNKLKNNAIKIRIKADLQNNTFKESRILQDNFYSNTDFTFNIYENSFINNLKKRFNIDSIKLEDLYKIVSFGLNTSDNKKYFVSSKINDKYKKAVMGRNVSKWVVKSFGYVLYDDKILTRKGDIVSFNAREKLILQRIGSEIIAAYDNEGLYCYNSTNIILGKDHNINLKYLLALLNSTLINFYYRNVFSMNSTLTVNVTQGYLSQIPIKIPSLTQEKKITDLVDKMLTIQKKYHEGKITGNEKELLEQQIKQIDWQIDQEVYKLYGITEEEKKIIEESLR